MSYFRIDDNFYIHPKVVAAGNAAVGLWVRCGAYSSAYLLDGMVPTSVAKQLGTRREINALTAAALWVPGADGAFHLPDYLEYNYSADQVRAARTSTADRQQRWRDRRITNGVTNVGDEHRDVTRQSRRTKPKPSSLAAAAAADASTAGASDEAVAAAAAALNLYIDHKVRTDAPHNESGYRRKLGDVLPAEHAIELAQFLDVHPEADRDMIARGVYGMTNTDIRRTDRSTHDTR